MVVESFGRGAWRKINYICILDFRETRKQMNVVFFKSRALITSKSPTWRREWGRYRSEKAKSPRGSTTQLDRASCNYVNQVSDWRSIPLRTWQVSINKCMKSLGSVLWLQMDIAFPAEFKTEAKRTGFPMLSQEYWDTYWERTLARADKELTSLQMTNYDKSTKQGHWAGSQPYRLNHQVPVYQ